MLPVTHTWDDLYDSSTRYPNDQLFISSAYKKLGKKIINLSPEQLPWYCRINRLGPLPFSTLAQQICHPFEIDINKDNLKECKIVLKENGEWQLTIPFFEKMRTITKACNYQAVIYSEKPWKIVFFKLNSKFSRHSLFKKVAQVATVTLSFLRNHVYINVQPSSHVKIAPFHNTVQASIETNDEGFQLHFHHPVDLPRSIPVQCFQIEPKAELSSIDKKTPISHFEFGITLIRRGGSNDQHARIIIEGLVMERYFTLKKLILPTKLQKVDPTQYNLPPEYSLSIPVNLEDSLFKCMCHFARPNVIEVKYLHDPIDFVERSQVYLVDRERAAEMLLSIYADIENPPKDQNIKGEASFFGNGAPSCNDWAKKKLAIVGIELPDYPFKYVFTPTNAYTPFTN